VPEGWVPFICRPADGVPEGWVVLPCISAGCVPEGVPAVEPEDASVACWPEGFAACAVAAACTWPEDADVLPLSCVQPAINIPATRIADAMIMMIVLFFMRMRVSLSFLVNTNVVPVNRGSGAGAVRPGSGPSFPWGTCLQIPPAGPEGSITLRYGEM